MLEYLQTDVLLIGLLGLLDRSWFLSIVIHLSYSLHNIPMFKRSNANSEGLNP